MPFSAAIPCAADGKVNAYWSAPLLAHAVKARSSTIYALAAAQREYWRFHDAKVSDVAPAILMRASRFPSATLPLRHFEIVSKVGILYAMTRRAYAIIRRRMGQNISHAC